MLWRAIDWKGEFDPAPEKEKPSDEEFQQHLEQLLNPEHLNDEWPIVDNQVTIPLLDDPVDVKECEYVINKYDTGVCHILIFVSHVDWLIVNTLFSLGSG